MKLPDSRHYSEEELLMHFLQEETAVAAREIAAHLRECGECEAILRDYADVVGRIQSWTIPQLPEDVWAARRVSLLAQYSQDFARGRGRGLLSFLFMSLQSGWDYALAHPLPSLGFVAVAVTFAMERTISTFRLDRILPGASEVFQILKQIL